MIKLTTFLSLCFLICVGNCSSVYGDVDLASPDGKIKLRLSIIDGAPVYRVSYLDTVLLKDSKLGFTLSDGTNFQGKFAISDTKTSSIDQTWKPVYGERSQIRDNYNEAIVSLKSKNGPVESWTVSLRCYDEGVAFRSQLLSEKSGPKIGIKSENTEFHLAQQRWAWCADKAQGKYRKKPISAMGQQVERPLTIEGTDSVFMAIAEANLQGYARMKLKRHKTQENCIVSQLSSSIKSDSQLTTPWRVLMIASSAGGLLENNSIILNLNEPCALSDTSWIKPGKVLREMTLTTAGGKAAIDFAVKHNFEFVEFDAGWYGHEHDKKSDATTVTLDPKRSLGPFDLHECIAYGKQHGIGIILYVNRRSLERQLDDVLATLEKWGVAGVKYGFVRVGSQQWTQWLHDAIAKAADHKLMVDIHDEYRSMGFARTYPNLMTQEGVGGDETSPSNHQTLVNIFTRYLAGSADFTTCYYADRVKENASHAHQLAKPICAYSPWQFLFWYDSPVTDDKVRKRFKLIHETPELEFWDAMPTVWDDTRVLSGTIGEHALIARRTGNQWFIGGLTDSEARTIETKLDFLNPNVQYMAHTYSDDASVDTESQVRIDRFNVNRDSTLTIKMQAHGGQAIRIVPATEEPNDSKIND